MRILVYSLILIILFIFILPVVLSLSLRNIPVSSQPSLKHTERIFQDRIISQVFISRKDNLSAIGVSLKNPYLVNKKDIVLKIFNNKGELLRESILNGRDIKDGDFVEFIFPPIKDSVDQVYQFQLYADSTDEKEALEVFMTDDYLSDSKSDKNMSFVSFYQPENIFSTYFDILKDLTNRMSGDSVFMSIYLLIFFISIMFLLLLQKRKIVN